METCRLCLDFLTSGNFKPIEGITRNMIEAVVPEINVNISASPVCCLKCATTVNELHSFRMVCLKRCNMLHLDKNVNIDLTIDKDRYCKTCALPIELNKFSMLRVNEPTGYACRLLSICLPDINFQLTDTSVMCESCLECLQKFNIFKSTCLDSEEKIRNYINIYGTDNNNQVNLQSIIESINSTINDESVEKNEQSDDTERVKPESSAVVENRSCSIVDNCNMLHDSSAKDSDIDDEFIEEQSVVSDDDEMAEKSKETGNLEGEGAQDKSMYHCKKCPFKTKHKRMLSWHLSRSHPKNSTSYKCREPGCNYISYTETGLGEHMVRWHQAEPQKYGLSDKFRFPCGYCDKIFKQRAHLDEHLLHKHKSDEIEALILTKVYSCDMCSDFKSVYKSELRRHRSIAHIDKMKNEKFKFSCDNCQYVTNKIGNLNRHLLTHTRSQKFVCQPCNKRFMEKRSLDIHILHHHSNDENLVKSITSKLHRCNHCDYKSFLKNDLIIHLTNMHENEQQKIICDQCSKIFDDKKSFTRHVLLVHKDDGMVEMVNDKLHCCKRCDYTSYQTSHFKRHMKTHGGKKPLSCMICKKGFIQKQSMDAHVLKHHVDDKKAMASITSKIHCCDKCDYKAIMKTEYNLHLKNHR